MRPLLITLAVGALVLGAACNSKRLEPEPVATNTEQPASEEGLKVGAMAPAITVANSLNWEGGPTTLESLQGKVVVLDFWAYW
jgi:cytochrome oxidase Cu insertion factor (SCO1/SenC/PrrC family)